MAKFLKGMGVVFLVLGIVGSFLLANGFASAKGFSFDVFFASVLTVLVFSALIYAAGSALETLESIREFVSMIHKEASGKGKESTQCTAPSVPWNAHTESKSSNSDEEDDSSTFWKCQNCGMMNPKTNHYCSKCNRFHTT